MKDARERGNDLALEFLRKFPTVNLGSAGHRDLGGWFHAAMQIGADMVAAPEPVVGHEPNGLDEMFLSFRMRRACPHTVEGAGLCSLCILELFAAAHLTAPADQIKESA